jgi:hypothetical protein
MKEAAKLTMFRSLKLLSEFLQRNAWSSENVQNLSDPIPISNDTWTF